ncbi:MAG: DNA repair protein RecO [Oscillospiraceae bacterium]|nr:DNA repair protein RecO [Oscillospiraceae bacterium]
MFKTTKALVLRQVRYKEADRILTLFSSTDGKITAKARGALRKNSKIAAATQQLCYAEMTLFGNRGKWTVNEAVIIEPFTALQTDLERFALGCYFAECLEALSVEDQPDAELLQLGLNSLYALGSGKYDPRLVKAAFEFRLMCLAGYAPSVQACAVCGKETLNEPCLSVDNGCVFCRGCRNASLGFSLPLCEDSLAALRYIVAAPAKQLFSFQIGEEALRRLGDAAERYLLSHAERRFSTLDYWKSIRTTA